MTPTASLPIPFAIGEVVWCMGHGRREEWVTCPICSGEKFVTMIQGDGTAFALDCGECGPGYNAPCGKVRRYIYERRPEEFRCAAISDIRNGEVRYSDGYQRTYVDARELFRDKDECAAKCAADNAAKAKADKEQGTHIQGSQRKSMAFSLSYWQNQKRDHLRHIGWIDERLQLIKENKMHLKVNKRPDPPPGGYINDERTGYRSDGFGL